MKVNLQRQVILLMALVLVLFAPSPLYAHQQPTTIVLLDFHPDRVGMELQIPLSELELAFGHAAAQDPNTFIDRAGKELAEYLRAHIRPTTPDGQPWAVVVTNMQLGQAEQTQSGPYQEIIIHLNLTPPDGVSPRRFVLNYDAILHQVVTHKALVGVRKDWETGLYGTQPFTAGVIFVDTATTKIAPLPINLAEGSWRTGFSGMVRWGMQHFKENINHLLFLLMLLLPATLLVNGTHWGAAGSTSYALKRLLTIAAAFTVGYLITLVLGVWGGARVPPRAVEMLIMVSVLVAAGHTVRPLFAGREIFVAAGFGLVHGLALASVIANLQLDGSQRALSILGFGLGVTLWQLFVLILVAPWLILLSRTPVYKLVTSAGAVLGVIAAFAVSAAHITGKPNAVSSLVSDLTAHAHLGIVILAIIALAAFAWQREEARRTEAQAGH